MNNDELYTLCILYYLVNDGLGSSIIYTTLEKRRYFDEQSSEEFYTTANYDLDNCFTMH